MTAKQNNDCTPDNCSLHPVVMDPGDGLVVKMARMETDLATLKALGYTTLATSVSIMLLIIGYFASRHVERTETSKTDLVQFEQLPPSAAK